MDVDSFSLLKYGFIVGLATYVFYRIIRAIVDFRAYAKIFNDCPGETDFHWLLGTLHKYPGPNEAGLQYDFEAMMKWPHFYRAWLGPLNPLLYIYHPDLIRIIIKSSAPKPRGRIFVTAYDMGLGWLGEGLLISNGSRWARNRRLLTPAFHFDILRSYVTVKNQAGDLLLDKMLKTAKENKSFEAFELVSPCLLDILLQCAFSHTSNCQTIGSGGPYLQAVSELLSLWTARFFFPLHHIDWIYKLSANGRKWNKLCKYVHVISDDLIAKRRTFLEQHKAQLQKNQGKNHMMSFVDILLTAVDEDGKGMTPLEIRNEADTFLFEGYDTTMSALCWTMYSLARWPQHQVKVQEEVDALLKGRDSDYILCLVDFVTQRDLPLIPVHCQLIGRRDPELIFYFTEITYASGTQNMDLGRDDFTELPYMTACIKEAIRNYSTVSFIHRMTDKDLDIDGHKIPKGTTFVLHLWGLHHNPSLWDRPFDYLPERFFGDNAVGSDPFKFVPFSAGPRNCIGQNFAMHELKIMVARIFHRFTLKLDPDHKVEQYPLATFRATTGIRFFAAPRKIVCDGDRPCAGSR